MIKVLVELIDDEYAQVSAEFLLLIAGLMIIVLLAMHIYQQYLDNLANQINDTEVNELLDKIDSLNDYI